MISELLKTTILTKLTGLKSAGKGWYTCNCPVCVYMGTSADTRRRFGIRFEEDGTIGAHCFNCTFATRWQPGRLMDHKLEFLLKHIGVSDKDMMTLKFQAFREKEAGDIFEAPKLEALVTHKWRPVNLPDNTMPLLSWLEKAPTDVNLLKCAEYALERGFPDLSQIQWCPKLDKEYNKRIIVPFYFHSKLVGYTARYYEDKPVETIKRFDNVMPEHFVYGLDRQRNYNREYTILTEGPMDAALVDGIAVIGSQVSAEQANIIKDLRKKVIVAPDYDENTGRMINAAIEHGWGVAFPNWDRGIKDVSDAVKKYGRLLTIRSIIDSTEWNPVKIQVKRKFKGI